MLFTYFSIFSRYLPLSAVMYFQPTLYLINSLSFDSFPGCESLAPEQLVYRIKEVEHESGIATFVSGLNDGAGGKKVILV